MIIKNNYLISTLALIINIGKTKIRWAFVDQLLLTDSCWAVITKTALFLKTYIRNISYIKANSFNTSI